MADEAGVPLRDQKRGDQEAIAQPPPGRLTGLLTASVLVVTVGSSFQFGYHIGCVNAPGKLVTDWIVVSHRHLFGKTLTQSEADFAFSIAVSIFAVGGMIGGLFSGACADKFGRKGGLLLNNIVAFIAAALMTAAKPTNNYPLLIAGRLVIGINCGLMSGLVPMYLTEVSPINLRGTLATSHQLLVTISILISQVFGLPYIWGNDTYWPWIFAFTFVPAVFQVLTLPFCPESPKWNLVVRNNVEQAERDLKKLRGENDVRAELNEMQLEAEAVQQSAKVNMPDLFKADLRWPLVIACMMMLSQQLTGINVTMFYSTVIFQDAGLKGLAPFYATIAMGFVNVLMTIAAIWLIDHPKFGRRRLHLMGLGGMLISAILIVVSLSLNEAGKPAPGKGGENAYQWASYGSILFVILFVVAFAVGPGPIPWFFVSELFASGARGAANSIAVVVNWGANLIVGLTFLPINSVLRQYSFIVYVAFCVLFLAFTWKYVPETKGRTVDEVTADWKARKSGAPVNRRQ